MKSLYHVGITVTDLDRAIEFYHKCLGLEFASAPTGYVSGKRIDVALNVPGAKLRLVNLVTKDGGRLEIIEYKEPPSPQQKAVACNATGSAHVTFLVDDIFAAKQSLETKGVRFYGDINHERDDLAEWYWIYFPDPDGIPLELTQIVWEKPEGHAAGIAAYKQARGWAQ